MNGLPTRPGRQVHEAAPFLSLHTALVPQGLGLQGYLTSAEAVSDGGSVGSTPHISWKMGGSGGSFFWKNKT